MHEHTKRKHTLANANAHTRKFTLTKTNDTDLLKNSCVTQCTSYILVESVKHMEQHHIKLVEELHYLKRRGP